MLTTLTILICLQIIISSAQQTHRLILGLAVFEELSLWFLLRTLD